tara:strand:- start:7638 stop:8390 length:753 start_codon:yes stop_codon:yes gene_type:complete
MQAKISVPTIKNIISILEKISEEAIFTFSDQGLMIRTVCANHFKMVDLWVKTDAFKEYQCDEEVKVGVVIDRIKDITKTLIAKDELVISYENDKLALIANGINRVVKLLRLEYMNEIVALPDFQYTYSLQTSSKEIRDFLKTTGKTVAFDSIIRKDSGSMVILWRSKNDDEPIEWCPDLQAVDDDEELIRVATFGDVSATTYTTEEVLASIGATQRTQTLLIQGGQDIPMRFDWQPYEGVRVISMVANRV